MEGSKLDESEDVSQIKLNVEKTADEAVGSMEQSNAGDQQRHQRDGVDNAMHDVGTPRRGQEENEEDEPEGFITFLQNCYQAVKRFFIGIWSHLVMCVTQLRPPTTSKDDDYDFTHSKRGKAILINNVEFTTKSELDCRSGSDEDAKALEEMFRELGFDDDDVERHDNLCDSEMREVLEKGARLYNHDDADCLAVAILSHGGSEPEGDQVKRDIIYGVDGSSISTASVFQTFQDEHCPGLVGKPRLFFLQACRGKSFDDGVDVIVKPGKGAGPSNDKDIDDDTNTDSTDAMGSRPAEENMTSPAPIFKDFLVMYATPPGHFAWRRLDTGSWFVQSLSSVMTKCLTPHISLTEALTIVARIVAEGYQSRNCNNPKEHGKKQVPVIESMLVKDIHFTKK